jgi:hypothetical protein
MLRSIGMSFSREIPFGKPREAGHKTRHGPVPPIRDSQRQRQHGTLLGSEFGRSMISVVRGRRLHSAARKPEAHGSINTAL